MSRSGRAVVLGSLAAIFLVPLVTAHALMLHVVLVEIGHLKQPSVDPGLSMLALVSVFASLPAAGALVALARWNSAAKRLRAIGLGLTASECGGIRYGRIESADVALFTAGFREPRIYATAGAERAMSPDVFRAALLHEQAHVAVADTRWRAALAAFGGAFVWLPPVNRYIRALVLRSEIAADRRAVSNGAGALALFDALVLAASVRGPVAALTGGVMTLRLAHLADPGARSDPAPLSGPVAIAAWAVGVPLAGHALLVAGVLCTSLVP